MFVVLDFPVLEGERYFSELGSNLFCWLGGLLPIGFCLICGLASVLEVVILSFAADVLALELVVLFDVFEAAYSLFEVLVFEGPEV